MIRVTNLGDEAAIYRAVDERLRAVAVCCEAEGRPVVACQILDALDRGGMPIRAALLICRASTLQALHEVTDSPTGWLVHCGDSDGYSLGAWTYSESEGHLMFHQLPLDGAP